MRPGGQACASQNLLEVQPVPAVPPKSTPMRCVHNLGLIKAHFLA
jgi:hypothetical protein